MFLAWRGQMQGGATKACRCISSSSANAADAPAKPESKGVWGRAADTNCYRECLQSFI
jgi:hypothetical protein